MNNMENISITKFVLQYLYSYNLITNKIQTNYWMSWEGENANSLLFGVVSGRLESKVYFLRRTQPYNDGQLRLPF